MCEVTCELLVDSNLFYVFSTFEGLRPILYFSFFSFFSQLFFHLALFRNFQPFLSMNPTLQQFNSTAALDAYLSPITADMFNSNTVPSGGSFYQSTTTTTTIQPQYNQINNQFGNPVPNPNSYQTGPNSYNPPSNPPNFQAPNFQAQNFQAVPKGAPPPPNKRPRLQKPKKSDFLKLPKNVLCSINSNDSFLQSGFVEMLHFRRKSCFWVIFELKKSHFL